jgi:FAD/FMN-containing dehydrogenase
MHDFADEDIFFPASANDVHLYNLRVPVVPLVVVTPRSTQLVSAAVKVAAEFNLKVQARSGGHSYANYGVGGADGHLVVDLKHFRDFSMDRTTWRATVGPAVFLKDLAQLLHDNGGRALPHGVCPTVCIGGGRVVPMRIPNCN